MENWQKNSDGETLYWRGLTIVAKSAGFEEEVRVDIFSGDSLVPCLDRFFCKSMECAKAMIKAKLLQYEHDAKKGRKIGLKSWSVKINGKEDILFGETFSEAKFDFLTKNCPKGVTERSIELVTKI